jgi:hypothetical protein
VFIPIVPLANKLEMSSKQTEPKLSLMNKMSIGNSECLMKCYVNVGYSPTDSVREHDKKQASILHFLIIVKKNTH